MFATMQVNKRELVHAMDCLAHDMAQQLVSNATARLAPYRSFYRVFQLVDPTGPDVEVGEAAWGSLAELCKLYDLEIAPVRDGIVAMRAGAKNISRSDMVLCSRNLLNYYHTRLELPLDMRCMHMESLARVVFSIPVCTAVVESLFSTMSRLKSKQRASLKDTTVANIIHCKDLVAVVDTPRQPFAAGDAQLDLDKALSHSLGSVG